jgi:hypothetical protein
LPTATYCCFLAASHYMKLPVSAAVVVILVAIGAWRVAALLARPCLLEKVWTEIRFYCSDSLYVMPFYLSGLIELARRFANNSTWRGFHLT